MMAAVHRSSAQPDQHVAMVGLMGSGKTTVGREVAARLELGFVDGDAVLGERVGRTAAQVLAEGGPDTLHDLEADIALEVLAHDTPRVFASAASIIDDERCRRALADRAIVVWLHAPPGVLADRATRSGHRPLAESDPAATLAAMAADRSHRYAASADISVDVERLSADAVVDRVVEALGDATAPMRRR